MLRPGLQVNEDKWRGETVLQSTFSSKLLNLGHASQPALTAANQRPPSLATQHVSARSLSSLCEFIRERRPLLVSLPGRAPQDLNRLPYVTLRTMRVNTLVHVLLRVKHSQLSPGEPVTVGGAYFFPPVRCSGSSRPTCDGRRCSSWLPPRPAAPP